jgi:hypothetical protein
VVGAITLVTLVGLVAFVVLGVETPVLTTGSLIAIPVVVVLVDTVVITGTVVVVVVFSKFLVA